MVVQLNSKETLNFITKKIEKRIDEGLGVQRDVKKLTSIIHRHLNNLSLIKSHKSAGMTCHKEVLVGIEGNVFLVDPKTGIIVGANKEAQDFYGYTEDEFVGMSIRKIHPQTLELAKKKANAMVAHKISKFKSWHVLSSGEVKRMSVKTYPVNSKGKDIIISVQKALPYLVSQEHCYKRIANGGG